MSAVLLAHSFFLHFDPKQWRTMQPYAPLGTLYAAAFLQQHGYEVALFDSMLAASPADLVPKLHAHRPRAVVFYEDSFNWLSKMCLTRMRAACFEMIALTKKQLGQNVPVIVAGSDPTDHGQLYFDRGADYAIIGEGEITLHELIEALLNKPQNSTKDIAGVAMPAN